MDHDPTAGWITARPTLTASLGLFFRLDWERGGQPARHIIFDAIKIVNHTLEDLTDGELRMIALEIGVLRRPE